MKLGKTKTKPRQRSRTLNPTEKPASFAYYARRDDQSMNTGRQAQREEKQQQRRIRGRFWLQRSGVIILLIAIVISAINALSLSPQAKILPVAGSDPQLFLHDQSAYEAAATDILKSSLWNRNKLTVNAEGFKKELMGKFPELTDVTLTLPLIAHRPIAHISTAQPALLLTTSQGSYMLDSTGKALLTAQDANRLISQKLPKVMDQSGLEVRLGHLALSSTSVDFIRTVNGQLTAKHVNIESMTLPPVASELQVKISGQPYYVRLNLQSDTARQQTGTYLATIAQLQKQGITPDKYVDVRVDGRAYYQ